MQMHKAPSSRIVQEPFDATAPRPSMAFPSSSVRTGSVHSGSDFSDMQSCFISNGGDPMVGGGFASRGIAIPQNTGNGQRAEQAWSYESNGSLSFDLGGMGLNSLPPNQIAHQQQQIGTERTQASHFFDDCLNSFQLPLARCLNLPPYKSQAEEFQANKQPPMFTSQSSLSIVIPSTSSSTTFNDSNVSIDSFNVPSYNKGQDTNNNSMFSQSLPNWSLQDNTTNLNEFFLGTESPFTNHVNRSNSIPAWVFTSSSSLPDVNHMGILGIPCTPSPVGNGHMPERIIHRSNSMDSYTSPLGFTVTSPSSSPVQFGHQVPQVQSPQSHQFQQSILGFPNTPQSSSPPCMNSTEYQHSSLHPNPNATFSNQHFQPTAINATKASSAPSRKRRMTAHLRSGVPPMFGAMMRTHSAPNNDASFQNSISIPSTSNMMWYPASSEKCVKPISTGSEGPDAATPILPPKLQQRRSSSTAALNRLEKPFICEEVECGKRFTRTHDLERHRRSSHLNAKDFRCTHCDASFSRKDASYRHMRLKKCNATASLDFPEPIV
ncbi:hypothetical protein BDR26DRAFT_873700 [Obelidium mucronatum]|nr:hypothetical protein BDR26DRAFT_873700 [Obelidium mucronatum]